MKKISIALDGPSGAGKSTIARSTAEYFGFMYVDTGAIYRCVGLYVLRNSADPKDEEAVKELLPQIKIDMRHDASGLQRMFLNGEDVTDKIRLPEVSIYASDVSVLPAVRSYLLRMQRDMADKYDVIMDGRDIGTVVLPNADLKIFLTAAPEDRAMRRYLELKQRKTEVTYEEVLSDMRYRDKNDSSRKIAPLKPASDAVILDTTGNPLQKSIELVRTLVEEKLKK